MNLTLLCIWAGLRGRKLDAAAVYQAVAAVAGWNAAITGPLRAMRRRVKGDWNALAIDSEPARQAILAAELEAERAEQTLLLWALAPWPHQEQRQVVSGAAALIAANLAAYLGSAATTAPAASIAAICASE